MVKILNNAGILYVQGEGIGQHIINNPTCYYYMDCSSSIIKNTINNDIINAENLKKHKTKLKIHLSMTFPDLNKPETILPQMKFLYNKYPGVFNWMGEVNLVKEALFKHGHKPVSIQIIKKWKPFMNNLMKNHMPLSLHCDLGNNKKPFKYLPLMKEVL